MWQVLCLTGHGLNTCWRPGKVAALMLQCNSGPEVDGPCSIIRLHR